jgi:hypothetical protein
MSAARDFLEIIAIMAAIWGGLFLLIFLPSLAMRLIGV